MPPPLKMASGSLEDITMGAAGGVGASSSASGSASPPREAGRDVGSVRFVGLRGSEVVVPESPTTGFMFCRFFLFFSFFLLLFYSSFYLYYFNLYYVDKSYYSH
jgi:hypothetical protein